MKNLIRMPDSHGRAGSVLPFRFPRPPLHSPPSTWVSSAAARLCCKQHTCWFHSPSGTALSLVQALSRNAGLFTTWAHSHSNPTAASISHALVGVEGGTATSTNISGKNNLRCWCFVYVILQVYWMYSPRTPSFFKHLNLLIFPCNCSDRATFNQIRMELKLHNYQSRAARNETNKPSDTF